jgi:hypothetical protein
MWRCESTASRSMAGAAPRPSRLGRKEGKYCCRLAVRRSCGGEVGVERARGALRLPVVPELRRLLTGPCPSMRVGDGRAKAAGSGTHGSCVSYVPLQCACGATCRPRGTTVRTRGRRRRPGRCGRWGPLYSTSSARYRLGCCGGWGMGTLPSRAPRAAASARGDRQGPLEFLGALHTAAQDSRADVREGNPRPVGTLRPRGLRRCSASISDVTALFPGAQTAPAIDK